MALQVDEARLKETLGHFATGVAIVTGADEGTPYGFTCQAFSSLSLEPPMVAIAPGKSSTSWPHISKSGIFCVNILAEHQESLCRDFAVSGGDKFAGIGWRQAANGAPLLDGVLAWVECAVAASFDAGDHEMVFGRIDGMGVNGGRPLLFYRGGFGSFVS